MVIVGQIVASGFLPLYGPNWKVVGDAGSPVEDEVIDWFSDRLLGILGFGWGAPGRELAEQPSIRDGPGGGVVTSLWPGCRGNAAFFLSIGRQEGPAPKRAIPSVELVRSGREDFGDTAIWK